MRTLVFVLLGTLCGCATAGEQPQPTLAPTISITVPAEGAWQARYAFPGTARQLLFRRSTDTSRIESWAVAPDFEIVETPQGEAVRRRDGAAFSTVAVEIPPVYRPLPSDYAPFSPFGDGGILFHSGRLLACLDSCGDELGWLIQLDSGGTPILINGVTRDGRAEWLESDSGRMVYVGASRPVESADLIAVIDGSLPERIRGQLVGQLPAFMRLFSERLGALPVKPMLFASYDVASPGGRYGRQGGTLPGQVFTHFYGSVWPERMRDPALADELAWFFAHEAAHLYQRQLFADGGDAWIHEGGADAMAALALRSVGGTTAANAERRIISMRSDCVKHRAGRSIRSAIEGGAFDAAYACGLLVNLQIDSAVRAIAPGSDGLFSVWRHYLDSAARGEKAGEVAFLAAISALAGADLARAVHQAVRSETWPETEGSLG